MGSQLIRASSWTTVIEARGNERGEVAQQRTSDAVCRDHRETSWLVGSVTFARSFGSLRIFVRLCARGYRQATNLSVSRRFDTVEELYVRASFSPLRQKSTFYVYVVRIAWLLISSLCQSTDPTDYSLTKGTSKKERTRLASSRCLLVTGSSLPSLSTPLIPPHLTLTRYPLFSRLFSISIFLFFSISLYKNGYQASVCPTHFLLLAFFLQLSSLASLSRNSEKTRKKSNCRWVYEFVEWKRSIMCFYFCSFLIGTTQCYIWSEKWLCFK